MACVDDVLRVRVRRRPHVIGMVRTLQECARDSFELLVDALDCTIEPVNEGRGDHSLDFVFGTPCVGVFVSEFFRAVAVYAFQRASMFLVYSIP